MRDGRNRLLNGTLSVALSVAMAMGGLAPAVAVAEEAAMGTEPVAGQASEQRPAQQAAPQQAPSAEMGVQEQAPQGQQAQPTEMGTQDPAPQQAADPQPAAPSEGDLQPEGQEAPAAETELKVEGDEAGPAQLETQTWYGMPLNDTWVNGSIDEKWGANFYKITLSKPGKLSVTFQGLSIGYTNIALQNKDNSVSYKSWSVNGSSESNPLTGNRTAYLDAGEYYVRVSPWSGSGTGTYRLRASFTPVSYTEKEPNNDSGHAMVLSAGTKVSGFFTAQDNSDWYRINVRASTTVVFSGENTDSDFTGIAYEGMPVYNQNLERLDNFWYPNDPQFSRELKLSAGTYYVKLRRNSDSGGPYTFKWNYKFPDVEVGHWAYDVISRAVDRGLFSGYKDGNFGPEDPVTRGQAVVVLWNMANKPQASGGKNFRDVKSGDYWYKAVRWASARGVVSGYSNGTFQPNRRISREELAVMLANYTKNVARKQVSGSASDYSGMYDAGSVAPYARTAVGWCFRNSILTGSGGAVRPKATATRAESAKMFSRVYDITR